MAFNNSSAHSYFLMSEIAGDYQSEDDIPDFLLPVAEAEIFQCSCYAVVCRLKRYEFTITSKAAVFTIPDYPDVTVAVPKNAVPTREKIPIVLKVRKLSKETLLYQIINSP